MREEVAATSDGGNYSPTWIRYARNWDNNWYSNDVHSPFGPWCKRPKDYVAKREGPQEMGWCLNGVEIHEER